MHVFDVTSDVFLMFGSKVAMGTHVNTPFCRNMHQHMIYDERPAFSDKWTGSAPKKRFIDIKEKMAFQKLHFKV